jgi:hypothetical protein
MKSDGIHRSVRSTRSERSAGDAPDLGRVARMPGTGLPRGKSRKRRSRDNRARRKQQSRRVLANWTLSIGLIAIAGLFFAVWQGMKFGRAGEGAAASAASVSKPGELVEMPRIASLPEDEAIVFVRKALAVRDAAKLTAYFRPAEVSPDHQLDFLRNLESRDGPIEAYQWLGNLDANNLTMDGVLVEFHSDGSPRNRLAVLVAGADGKWKVDFDAFARSVAPSWDEFLRGTVPVATVRACVVRDSYYNGLFSDENAWQCVSLASPDTEEILIGYCRKQSPQGNALKWLLSKDATINRAILEIRHSPGAEQRQVEISRVLAEEWVTSEKPFDERFK